MQYLIDIYWAYNITFIVYEIHEYHLRKTQNNTLETSRLNNDVYLDEGSIKRRTIPLRRGYSKVSNL